MNLIEIKNDKSLNIYSLNPNLTKIAAYKKRILEEHNITFASLRTNSKQTLQTFLNNPSMSLSEITFNHKLSNKTNLFSSYYETTVPFYQLSDIEQKIVEAYIENYYSYLIPQTIISDNDPNRYLLATTDKVAYLTNRFGPSYQTTNNLILPKELYLLQLIYSSQIKSKEVLSFIKGHENLFHLSLIQNFPNFENLLNFDILTEDTYYSIFQRSVSESKIIKALKKTSK